MSARLIKRIQGLEAAASPSPITVILCQPGECSADAVQRWERERGPIGQSYALVVNFVEAAL